jgi:hypothetical protein
MHSWTRKVASVATCNVLVKTAAFDLHVNATNMCDAAVNITQSNAIPVGKTNGLMRVKNFGRFLECKNIKIACNICSMLKKANIHTNVIRTFGCSILEIERKPLSGQIILGSTYIFLYNVIFHSSKFEKGNFIFF